MVGEDLERLTVVPSGAQIFLYGRWKFCKLVTNLDLPHFMKTSQFLERSPWEKKIQHADDFPGWKFSMILPCSVFTTPHSSPLVAAVLPCEGVSSITPLSC